MDLTKPCVGEGAPASSLRDTTKPFFIYTGNPSYTKTTKHHYCYQKHKKDAYLLLILALGFWLYMQRVWLISLPLTALNLILEAFIEIKGTVLLV